MATGFTVLASGGLTAAVAKSIINIIAGTTRGTTLVEFSISFDGADSTKVPVLIELCGATMAGAGTKTSFTPLLIRGDPAEVAAATAAINYTVEPTVLVVLKQWLISPTTGIPWQMPLGREVIGTCAAPSARKGLVFRVTAPFAVNYAAYAEYEE